MTRPPDWRATKEDCDFFRQLERLRSHLGGLGLPAYNPPANLALLLGQALSTAPRAEGEIGGVLAAGWDDELDALFAQEQRANDELDHLMNTLVLTTGLRSLQLKRDARSGQMLLAVSAADARRVPADWNRIGKGREQYSTERLRQLSDDLIEVEAVRADAERLAWQRLWEHVAAAGPHLSQLARDLAQIDVLTTLAHVAVREEWVRPTIVDERVLEIENSPALLDSFR